MHLILKTGFPADFEIIKKGLFLLIDSDKAEGAHWGNNYGESSLYFSGK